MSIRDILCEKWRNVLDALWSDDQRRLLEILREEYVDEAQMVTELRQHAQRMHYPQFRERLLHIASEEERHAEWLREKISALGGEIPQVSLAPKTGKNSWECLLMDLEKEKRCCADLEDRLRTVEKVDPEIALGLRQIHEEENNHCEEITEMLMRSDAYALWPA